VIVCCRCGRDCKRVDLLEPRYICTACMKVEGNRWLSLYDGDRKKALDAWLVNKSLTVSPVSSSLSG